MTATCSNYVCIPPEARQQQQTNLTNDHKFFALQATTLMQDERQHREGWKLLGQLTFIQSLARAL